MKSSEQSPYKPNYFLSGNSIVLEKHLHYPEPKGTAGARSGAYDFTGLRCSQGVCVTGISEWQSHSCIDPGSRQSDSAATYFGKSKVARTKRRQLPGSGTLCRKFCDKLFNLNLEHWLVQVEIFVHKPAWTPYAQASLAVSHLDIV